MPQIGPLEILVVGVIALIVFGPHRLPEMARSVGKAVAEFRRQASDLRDEFSSGLDEVDDEQEQPPPTSDPVAAEDLSAPEGPPGPERGPDDDASTGPSAEPGSPQPS